MKMRLYQSATSPYARKVRVALEELGLADAVELVETDPFAPTPEFLAVNPLGTVPAMVTERGEMLPDSTLILDYLVQRQAGLASLPRGQRRWDVLRRTALADGAIDAAVSIRLEKRRPESIHYTPWMDRKAAAIRRALDVLSGEAGLLALQTPGLCEIAAGVALAYLDFRLPYLEWRKNREPLAHWYTVFAQRPSMQKTQPPAG